MGTPENQRPSEHEIAEAVESHLLLIESGDSIVDKVHKQIANVLAGRQISKHLRDEHPGWTREDFEKFADRIIKSPEKSRV